MATQTAPRRNLWQRVWSVFDPNERYCRSLMPQVQSIAQLEAEFEGLSQQDMQDRLRKIRSLVAAAREAKQAEHDQLPPAEDSDTRRARHKEIIAAEKAVLDAHLVEVFAAVREAAKRTLSMRHFDVQMLGGIVLHEGRIAEMKTGEGKTLTATCPLVLNALAGRGAHVVTVNDYLARRDAEWMGKIYRYLGLSVGVIQHDLDREERQASYGSDITYITNHEIGFDYLRDHSSAWRPEHLVIRELHYAIIDEVDSILIDEARVPLIISASRGKPAEKYRRTQEIVSRLIQGEQDLETKETTGDFYIDEKSKNATITEDGQRKVEIALGIDNLNDSSHIEDMHLVSAALKANFCYKRDVDYILGPTDEAAVGVVIVDSFTGRPQPGRRWSDGLHQAIEAKEKVQIQDEQQTIATVTYQNFFLMYNRLSGMTGTAKTEEAEFVGIYEMPVVVVPTNKPMVRTEHPDVVYKTEEWKIRGICCEIVQYFCRRQPVLVGTRSVEMSERVSARLRPDKLRLTLQLLLLQWHIMEHEKKLDKALLKQIRAASTVPLEALRQRDVDGFLKAFELDAVLDSEGNLAQLSSILEIADEQALRDVLTHGVPHEVLNARHHEREAQIVAQAGRLGAVTIATNMAGRGTDIVLGGNPEPDVEELLLYRGIDPKSLEATLFMNQALKGEGDQAAEMASESGGLPRPVLTEIAAIRGAWRSEQADVVSTGGLHILGTERHESRRIDNQLRGRSGRQGDPGSSRFYISLQDELMRLFGPERWGLLMNQWPEEQPVEAKLISRAMNNAQKKVEGRNYDMRKSTLRYDDVMNVQRLHIYAERRRILEGVDLRAAVSRMMGDLVDETLRQFITNDSSPDDWDVAGVWAALNQRFPLKDQLAFEDLSGLGREALGDRLRAAAERAYDDKENDFIRSVVEFELQASIHETLQQVADREAVSQVLTMLWPLADYLPARLAGTADSKVPEVLFAVAREALEAGPRGFILDIVRDRLQGSAANAAAALEAGETAAEVAAAVDLEWPLRLDEATLAAGAEAIAAALGQALDRGGWSFVTQALQRQMAATVDRILPLHCDLTQLVGELGDLWPFGTQLDAAQLAGYNFGVVEDRLHRAADAAIEELGPEYISQAADHRLRRAVDVAQGDTAWLSQRIAEFLPAGARAGDLPDDLDALLDTYWEPVVDGLVLRAVEEVAGRAVAEAHRQMAAGDEEAAAEEEELAFGDLRRLIDRFNEQWACGDALNPWEIEQLPAAQVRSEMVERLRTEIRSRGRAFVTSTASVRLAALVRQAVFQHYSLAGLCSRLAQLLEVPGIFVPESYAEATTAAELSELLTETARETFEEAEPEQWDKFRRALPGVMAEGFNPKRLCDVLNAELPALDKLTPAELAEVPVDEVEELLLERVQQVAEAFEVAFVQDAVRQFVHLQIEDFLGRWYNLRAVSGELAAAWPLRPDAVRASKLKGWSFQELGRKLKDLLTEAYRWEEWRFTRRFVMRLLEDGLTEAVEVYCGGDPGRGGWDLPGLCADLNERWPLAEALEPRQLPEYSRVLLVDTLLTAARRAYGEHERAFVRETARHRYSQQLDQIRREHYSLGRAAGELNRRWNLDGAIQPLALAELRAVVDDPARFTAAVQAGIEPVIARAQEAFLQDCVERRIVESVDDVLTRYFNVSRLVRRLLGHWPLAEGVLDVDELRGLPFRDAVDGVRQVLRTATGSLRRRLVFHNLRSTARELDRTSWLGDDPAQWQVTALVAALGAALPSGGLLEAAPLAGAVLRRALAADLEAAARSVPADRYDWLERVVKQRYAAQVDALLVGERRPQALVERLSASWPVAADLPVEPLRGLATRDLRDALVDGCRAAWGRSPQQFIEGATRLWLDGSIDSALDRYWPADKTPGPWVMAQVVDDLNHVWDAADLLHPTAFKGLERDVFRTALRAIAHGPELVLAPAVFVRQAVAGYLSAELATAAGAHLGQANEAWDLDGLAGSLAAVWPTAAAPTAAVLRQRLTPALVDATLDEAVEALDPRVVADYESEPVQAWLDSRLEAGLEQCCAVSEVARVLGQRWPLGDLDLPRMAGLTWTQLREALVETVVAISRDGGRRFARTTAELRLAKDVLDIADSVAQGQDDEVAELLLRWPWAVTAAEVVGRPEAEAQQVLRAAADGLDAATLEEVFLYETARRRLDQAVEQAQTEHCNPEIASDRWDIPAFIAALERDWPIAGRLTPAALAGLTATALSERTIEALTAAFDADPEGFTRATTRQQVGRSVHDVLSEHASLDRLAQALTSDWPRPSEFSAETLSAARPVALEGALRTLGLDLGLPFDDAEGQARVLVDNLPGALDDLGAVVQAVIARWPAATALTTAELDERLITEHLQERLWQEFLEEPRAFVKAVALEEVPRQLERRLMLEAIDTNWCDHLEAMDYLMEGINLRGYAQTDPFIAYRKDGRQMFENMLGRVRETVIGGLFETTEHQLVEMHSHGRLGLRIAVEFQNVQELASKAEELTASHQSGQVTGGPSAAPSPAPALEGARRARDGGGPAAGPAKAPVTVDKVGRNDACPCGSGKKYKHCCGRGK